MLQNDEAALLQGEKEAEKMIVEAYSALLLAFLSTERSICHFKIPFLLIHFHLCFSQGEFYLLFTVRVYAMLLLTVSRITTCQFLYLCWRDSWYVFLLTCKP